MLFKNLGFNGTDSSFCLVKDNHGFQIKQSFFA